MKFHVDILDAFMLFLISWHIWIVRVNINAWAQAEQNLEFGVHGQFGNLTIIWTHVVCLFLDLFCVPMGPLPIS